MAFCEYAKSHNRSHRLPLEKKYDPLRSRVRPVQEEFQVRKRKLISERKAGREIH